MTPNSPSIIVPIYDLPHAGNEGIRQIIWPRVFQQRWE